MIRSVLGAKRRWFLHFVESDRDRQACCCWSCGKVEIAPAISKGAFCPSFPQLFARRFIHFSAFTPFIFRIESPRISMRCALCFLWFSGTNLPSSLGQVPRVDLRTYWP